jgi:hypothetical protein
MTHTSLAGGVGAALLVGALAGAPLAARAQVYKCLQANGTTGYQATPCPTGAKPPARPTAAQLNAQRAAAPGDAKPYVDPYAGSADARPHSEAPPAAQAQPSPWGAAPAPAGGNTSSLVADVQARNRRENQQQAYEQAHKDDKRVDMAACNSARHNLGVLSEQRPVFRYDNKGNRVFVEDNDRARTIAEAQKVIAATCP